MPSERAPDLYAVMHLAPDCTDEEIKVQWRHYARLLHPDTHAGDPWFEEEFKKLEAAYEVLGHPDRRAKYDQERLFREPAALDFDRKIVSDVVFDERDATTAYRSENAEETPEVSTRRVKLTLAAVALVILLMAISVVRAVRGAHPVVPESEQMIDGTAFTAPAFERSSDPAIRTRQDAFQSRLSALQPVINQLIGQGQQTLTMLESQDRIEAGSNPAWSPPLDRQRDEAAIQADIRELSFQMADIEQQIDQMASPSGADQGAIEQELEALEVPHQPISSDISLAQHDLRAASLQVPAGPPPVH